MLFGALLAPAILAGGLLAGEIRGFEAGGEVAASVMGQGTGLVLEPVLVPAPARPDRRYEGSVPAPVRVVPEAPRSVVAAAPSPEPPVVVEEEPVTPAPVRTRAGCPGEWEDTWLWELCREQEEQRAGGSWVPGI
ncbi:hypothetical protein GCM10022419_101530 [Nonomuraea rosea]|uniref:Uncharacterized protein n=1 Tax=Nonomuraea rosea TaxID=638574 RepID=A0ABP6Z948_9ACTN